MKRAGAIRSPSATVGLRPIDVNEFVEISAPNHAPSDDLCPSMDRLLSKIFSTFLLRGLEGRVESGQREFRLEVTERSRCVRRRKKPSVRGSQRTGKNSLIRASRGLWDTFSVQDSTAL